MTDLQIKYFLRVAEQLSFTAASCQLYVSQSSVSRQIIALERELGHELIDRTTKKSLRLTPAGEVFFRSFKKMESELFESVAEAKLAASRGCSILRIGLGMDWELSGLVKELEELTADTLFSKLDISSHPFGELHKLLEAGTLDLIVCTSTSIQTMDGFGMCLLAEVPATVYYFADNPLADDPDRLEKLPAHQPLYVLPEEEAPLSTAVNSAIFMAEGIKPHVVVKPNRASIYLAIYSGNGFAIFDNLMCLRNDSKIRHFKLDSKISISAIYRSGDSNPLIGSAMILIKNWFERL